MVSVGGMGRVRMMDGDLRGVGFVAVYGGQRRVSKRGSSSAGSGPWVCKWVLRT